MQELSVAAARGRGEEYRLRRHEGEFFGQVAADHCRVDREAAGDRLPQQQDGIGRQERLGKHEAAVGGVVERAFEPLRGGRPGRIGLEADDVAGESGHALAAHRIALVRHRRGADLAALGGLVQLLEAGQQPDVGRELGGRLGDPGEAAEEVELRLSRRCLAGHRIGARKPHFGGDAAVELSHLRVVAEELLKRRLRPGRALGAAQQQAADLELEPLEVEQEVGDPQAGALADGDRLRRLEVRVAEAGQVAMAECERGERAHHSGRSSDQQRGGVAQHDQIRVVGDVARGGAEVEPRSGGGCHLG